MLDLYTHVSLYAYCMCVSMFSWKVGAHSTCKRTFCATIAFVKLTIADFFFCWLADHLCVKQERSYIVRLSFSVGNHALYAGFTIKMVHFGHGGWSISFMDW